MSHETIYRYVWADKKLEDPYINFLDIVVRNTIREVVSMQVEDVFLERAWDLKLH